MSRKPFPQLFAVAVLLIIATTALGNLTASAANKSIYRRQHKHKRSESSAKLKALTDALVDAAGPGNLDGNPHEVSVILNAGARINAQDSLGRTALTQAVDARHPRIVRFLLRKGAKVNLYARGSASGSQGGGDALDFAQVRMSSDREFYLHDRQEKAKYGSSGNLALHTQLLAADKSIFRMLKNAGARKSRFQVR